VADATTPKERNTPSPTSANQPAGNIWRSANDRAVHLQHEAPSHLLHRRGRANDGFKPMIAISSNSDEFQGEPDLAALSAAHELLKKEPERALPILAKVADEGSLLSMIYLGDAYRKGIGVSVDIAEAKKWLRRATDAGSRVAPHQLGLVHLDLKEYQQAEEMFRLGASWHYLPSLYRLGVMFADGVGTTPQPVLAREFFESASSRGHVFAKRRLASMLLRGSGGSVNIPRGVWLFVSGFIDAITGAVSDPVGQPMRS
jgi:TPR repeat protein